MTELNKDGFLQTVWKMFYDYRDKTGWHNWRGQFNPNGGPLFGEGFLKYELHLVGNEPSFHNLSAYDSEWFGTTTAFLAAVQRYSNQTTYDLFMYQFSHKLADVMKKEAPSHSFVQEMMRKDCLETTINFLASLADLSKQDFDKLNLTLLPDGTIEVLD